MAVEERTQNAESPDARTITQIIDMFVIPELQKRYEAGKLPESLISPTSSPTGGVRFKLPSLCLIELPDNKPVRVKFGNEANIEVLLQTKKEVVPNKSLNINDGEIAQWRFTDRRDRNAGWIVMFNQNGRITFSMNFLRNGTLAKRLLRHARGFLSAADHALIIRQPRVALENLFHVVEKTCKAELMTMPLGWAGADDSEPMKRLQHSEIKDKYAVLGRHESGRKMYDVLAKHRNAATYHLRDFKLTGQELRRLLVSANDLHIAVTKWVSIAGRTPRRRRIGG